MIRSAALFCLALMAGACAPMQAKLFAETGTPIAVKADAQRDADLARIAKQAVFEGVLLVSHGDSIVYERAFGTIAPDGDTPHRLGQVWRWHSISKQIAATLAMMAVAEGKLDIDAPIATYLPDTPQPFADKLTTAQLMQHISGLRHADDGPIADNGYPRFYTVDPNSMETGLTYCEGPTDTAPGMAFRYGDCDYVMVAAILEAIYAEPYADLVRRKFLDPLDMQNAGVAEDAAVGVAGFEGGLPERTLRLGSSSAAAAHYGTALDLWTFSRALMTGRLIPPELRARMWTGDGRYGYAALGQWEYTVPVPGCPVPLRLIERRGAGMGTQARNIILPERDMIIIAFTNRSEADFPFGEPWTGEGFTLDLLSAVACR